MTLSCADTVLQSHLTESAEFYRSIIEREPQSRAEAESSSEVASELCARVVKVMETACGFEIGNWALRGYNDVHSMPKADKGRRKGRKRKRSPKPEL